MLDESGTFDQLRHGGGGSLTPGRPERVDGPRPAIDPPAPPSDGALRSYPSAYRTLTREDVLDILRDRGPSTRHQMFEHVFGPSHLSACENPSSYVHDAVTDLDKVGLIVRKGHERRSQIWALARTPAPPPIAPLFDGVKAPETGAVAAAEPPANGEARARTFVADVVLPNLAIPLRDFDLAEALVADIFAEPHAPLPECAIVAGWRRDLADLAYASSADLRSIRFAGLDVGSAEAAWNEILVGYAVQTSEHGIALRLVVDALSGVEAPTDFGRAWVGDAFAQLRMPPSTEATPAAATQSSADAATAADPEASAPSSSQSQPIRGRRTAPHSPTVAAPAAAEVDAKRPSVSEALQRKALVEYTSDSPAGQLSVRYAPMIRQAYDAGVGPEEIADRLVAEAGIQVPLDMAVLLIRRVCACAR